MYVDIVISNAFNMNNLCLLFFFITGHYTCIPGHYICIPGNYYMYSTIYEFSNLDFQRYLRICIST